MASSFSEGTEPDVLFGLGASRVPVVASTSLDGSDPGPPRCPVYGAGVARRLDEGFDEDGGGAIALGTVTWQATADDGEEVRADVR